MMGRMGENTPLVITLDGDWDIYRRAELEAALRPMLECPQVVLDCSAVTYADSTVLSVLATLRKERVARGYPACRVVPSATVSRLFEITQMSRLWPCYENVDAAVRSFNGTPNPNSA